MAGRRLSFPQSFEKPVILHEKKTPKATSVTSGVTLTDRVQSGGLTGRLLAAGPTTARQVFGAESDNVGHGFPKGAPGNNAASPRPDI